MNIQTFYCHRYIYNVKYKSNVIIPVKSYNTNRYKNQELLFIKEKNIEFAEVNNNAVVDKMLVFIKDTIPDWIDIEVIKIDKN